MRRPSARAAWRRVRPLAVRARHAVRGGAVEEPGPAPEVAPAPDPPAPDPPAPDPPAGPPRPAVDGPTHVGPLFDAAVARTRARMQPEGVDADYDLAYAEFDLAHFLLQAPRLLEAVDHDPLRTFLRNGPGAVHSPNPGFDTAAYLARHPERREDGSPFLAWLREGRARGEVADPAPGLEAVARLLGREPADLAGELTAYRTDLAHRLRTGTLGEMLARAAEVEPLVGEVWPATTRPTVPPLYSEVTVAQVAAIRDCQTAAGHRRARVVVVASDPRWGGGRRAEGHLAHALADRGADPADVVVLYTDHGGHGPPGRFPPGTREVDLAAALGDLQGPPAQRVLVELLRSLRAESVVNVNSRLLYGALVTHGKALAASERIFLMMFCNEQMAMGNWLGIPLRFFYRAWDVVDGVLTDSRYLADWLTERHRLDGAAADRIRVLRAPVDPSLPLVDVPERAPGARPQVFWAGRWDRQKRTGLVLEVARRMPEVDLRMWGEAVLAGPEVAEVPDNVRLEGRYAHVADLALDEADVWLYTSGWDGVPSQLLEVAMTGVPLVATRVGGTGEVLDEEDSWPVDDDGSDDPAPYVDAIRAVLAHPAAARARARALRERMLRERTAEQYADTVLPLLLPGEEDG